MLQNGGSKSLYHNNVQWKYFIFVEDKYRHTEIKKTMFYL